MEAAETQLARALAALTTREFPQSRGLETRVDAYLQLEGLLRLEDSERSVQQLCAHLPALLGELRWDLQRSTLRDELHAALRCLSYFMHHRSLATAFSDEHMVFFLGELVRLLFSTSDASTYKLSLWCLTAQNFPADRHSFLPRTVEGLVQAVVNPFKSRAIEVQALKGLHLLLIKYPQQVGVDGGVLSIWVRPIASRLSSSEASTRTQAKLVLEEASKHLFEWSQETLKMVQDCAVKYILPVMKIHMDRDRHKDAVFLWQLMLVLLKSRFSADLAMLNDVLYVPEKCMQDENAAVRLITMQAWAGLVDVFHDSRGWLFQKAVVGLLVWPIQACLEQELLLNVVEAAFVSCKKIVTVAVQDFNEYWKTQQSGEPLQQNMPQWKLWFGELVMSPLLTLLQKRRSGNSDASGAVELDQFVDFAKQMWAPGVRDFDKSKSSPTRSESSSSTTMGGSSTDIPVVAKRPALVSSIALSVPAMNDTLIQNVEDLSLTGGQISDNVCITYELIGIAFLLEDIYGAVQNLITESDESCGVRNRERASDLALCMWRGFCLRIHSGRRQEETSQAPLKFGLRLLRMSIDFSFGVLTSRSGSADLTAITDIPTPTDRAGHDTENQSNRVVVASVGFGLEWQLELLAPLLTGIASPRDVLVSMLHPKSKLFNHIIQRMDYLKDMYFQCAVVLKKWNCSEAGDFHMNFSAKANVVPYLVINLIFEYAVYIDDANNDNADSNQSTLMSLDIVVKKLKESVKTSDEQWSKWLEAVIRFGEDAIRAAHELFEDQAGGADKRSMLDELVRISKSVTEHTYESQQHASLLLDLHQSLQSSKVDISANASIASSTTPSEASDTEERVAVEVVQESEFVSASLGTSTSSLLCLMSGEISSRPSTSLVKPSPDSSPDEQAKPQSKGHQSPDQSLTTNNEKTNVNSVPTTPEKASEKQKVNEVLDANLQVLTKGSQSAPEKITGRTRCPNLGTSQCIYPDLVGCSEGISLLYRHFPMGFRPFFSFYKVKTIGDLSALPVEKVRTFGLKEPVSTVRRALEEFNGRKDCMKSLTGSPFRQKSGSATTNPAIPMTSPHKPSKRPFQLESGGIAQLALEKRQHKRTKRSLVSDGEGNDEEEESEGTLRTPKLADRVTFCLKSSETGETRITRPGEDSQDQLKPSEKVEEKESVQEKVDTYTLKLLQHLQRSAYYMDKLIAEEESMHSEEASLQTSIATVGGVITNYQEAHALVSRLAVQLQVAAETSSKRCRKLLDKGDHA